MGGECDELKGNGIPCESMRAPSVPLVLSAQLIVSNVDYVFSDCLGAPLIISPHHRLSNGLNHQGGGGGFLTQASADSLLYAAAASPYTTAADYATYLSLAEYPNDHGMYQFF